MVYDYNLIIGGTIVGTFHRKSDAKLVGHLLLDYRSRENDFYKFQSFEIKRVETPFL